METERFKAQAALHTIAQAETLAARNGQNNGIIPLVWGASVLLFLTGFDVVPRLLADPDVGLLVTGGCLWLLPVLTGVWTCSYRRRLPVRPQAVEKPRLYFWWVWYHVAVLCGGMALAYVYSVHLHNHCLMPGTFTVIGLVDAAPLLYVGWTQRRRAGRLPR